MEQLAADRLLRQARLALIRGHVTTRGRRANHLDAPQLAVALLISPTSVSRNTLRTRGVAGLPLSIRRRAAVGGIARHTKVGTPSCGSSN